MALMLYLPVSMSNMETENLADDVTTFQYDPKNFFSVEIASFKR